MELLPLLANRAMEERWVEFGEIIREENEKAGKFGNFGSLLDKDGKLGANWVRRRGI